VPNTNSTMPATEAPGDIAAKDGGETSFNDDWSPYASYDIFPVYFEPVCSHNVPPRVLNAGLDHRMLRLRA